MPGFPVHHQLLELAQTHVHRVSDTQAKKGAPLVVGSLIIMQIQSGSMTSRQLSSENLGLIAVKLGSWIRV